MGDDDEKTLGGSKFNTRRGKSDLEEGDNELEKLSRGRTSSTLRMVRLKARFKVVQIDWVDRKGINWRMKLLSRT